MVLIVMFKFLINHKVLNQLLFKHNFTLTALTCSYIAIKIVVFVFRSESHVCHYIVCHYIETSGFFAKNYFIEEIVGVTGSSNLVVKAQLMRIGITKFIAIATPAMKIIVNFTIHINFYYFKETIILY